MAEKLLQDMAIDRKLKIQKNVPGTLREALRVSGGWR
jgi:hypothetical protein